MSIETKVQYPEADVFECTEGNTEVSDKEGEFAEALAVSETYSCYTLLRCQLGRAYNVHGNV